MKLLTWEECAELLRRPPTGAARQMLYNLAKEGLPFVQVGRQRLFDPEQVEAWLRQRAELQAEGRAPTPAPAPAPRPSPKRRPSARARSAGAPKSIAELARGR